MIKMLYIYFLETQGVKIKCIFIPLLFGKYCINSYLVISLIFRLQFLLIILCKNINMYIKIIMIMVKI